MKMLPIRMAAATVAIAACTTLPIHAQDTTSDDKSFLKEASEGNLFEVNLAKLALQKSQDPNVRKFAEKMIADHERLGRDMKPLVIKLGVKEAISPGIGDRAKYEELKLKSGISFDRAYVETMVKDHNDDLKKFIQEEQKTTNPDVKATVSKAEATIREHTEMIDKIAHMGGIETPPMPSS